MGIGNLGKAFGRAVLNRPGVIGGGALGGGLTGAAIGGIAGGTMGTLTGDGTFRGIARGAMQGGFIGGIGGAGIAATTGGRGFRGSFEGGMKRMSHNLKRGWDKGEFAAMRPPRASTTNTTRNPLAKMSQTQAEFLTDITKGKQSFKLKQNQYPEPYISPPAGHIFPMYDPSRRGPM